MGTPSTNSPNLNRLSRRQAKIAKQIAALGTLPPADPLAIEVLIYPKRIEIRPLDSDLDSDLDADSVTVDEASRRFKGPLADLKQHASDRSRPGFRVFVTERRNKRSTSIKVEIRTDQGYWSRSFRNKVEAREYIDSLIQTSRGPCLIADPESPQTERSISDAEEVDSDTDEDCQ